MEGWKLFLEGINLYAMNEDYLIQNAAKNFDSWGVYPNSIKVKGEACFFIAKHNKNKFLIIYGNDAAAYGFNGSSFVIGGIPGKICNLDVKNCKVLHEVFPFTRPSCQKGHNISLGLGDRLGLASAGHIRLIRNYDVFPVLAQQSIRELNLTGRTYEDVLCAASWSVFQEGYTKGFGADGDHLKHPDEVLMAINSGFTMITLDCSEHIDNTAAVLDASGVNQKYALIPLELRLDLESRYQGKEFNLKSGTSISFSSAVEFKRAVLVYLGAIKFAADIFNSVIKACGKSIDFEISIDETSTPTSPESHYFVASELIRGGVEITSLAPRFCGTLEKGIDYKGDVLQFEREFAIHAKIAEHFGYKISVHSGSDKFSIFPFIGKHSMQRYHLKTAGTNWLEAVRIIALKDPQLFRRIYKFAVSRLEEAKKYYHISADPGNVSDIDTLSDSELPELLNCNDSRQILHITYGLILNERNEKSQFIFKDEIFHVLNEFEEDYYKALESHIGKHLRVLGIVR